MVEDLGEITKQGTTATTAGGPVQNGYMQMYLTHLHWMFGLQIADERCIQRIANVNPTVLSSPVNFDENVLIDAINFLPGRGLCNGRVEIVWRVDPRLRQFHKPLRQVHKPQRIGAGLHLADGAVGIDGNRLVSIVSLCRGCQRRHRREVCALVKRHCP